MDRYRRIKYIVLALGIGFVIAVTGYIIKSNMGTETRTIIDEGPDISEIADAPDILIKPFIRDNIEGGEVRYSINASEGRLYSEYGPSGSVISQRIEISEIHEIRIFTKDERSVTISADRATIFTLRNQTRNISLHSNIAIEHPSMGILRTQNLDFSFADNMIRTEDSFIIENKESIIEGKGFEYNTVTDNVEVLGGLEGTLYFEDNPEPLFFIGETMRYIEEESRMVMEKPTAFLFDTSCMKAGNTEIFMDSEMNVERIELSDTVSAELIMKNDKDENERYRLFSRNINIFFYEGRPGSMSLNNGFLMEKIDEDMFISGHHALISFRVSEGGYIAESIDFYNGFYIDYIDSGFSGYNGTMDLDSGIMMSDSSPVIYNYPYITKAQEIIIDNRQKTMKASKNIHTIIPGYENENEGKASDAGISEYNFDRMDIRSNKVEYDMKKDMVWYKNNCEIDTDSLTISADDIKLYNKKQLVQITGNVKGNLTSKSAGSSDEEKLYFDTEYMHYDAKGEIILLKEIEKAYPVVWQKGFRASSKSIIVKPGEDYVFFSEEAESVFFRDFYEESGGQNGFFSFDDSDMPVEVSADSIELFEAEKIIIYSGSVYAKKGENSLATDLMTVYMDDRRSIERVECINSLKIGGKDKYIEGDKGTYYKDNEEFHIEGGINYNDKMTSLQNAEKLIYYIDENRYSVFGTEIITKYRFEEPLEVPRIFPKHKRNILK